MDTDLRALLEGTLRGTLSAEDIERAVERHWSRRDIVHHLTADALPALPAAREVVGRHGFTDQLVNEVLYGEVGKPACLLVTTPDPGRYDRSFRELIVPPHVHGSAHIAVVISGHPLWVVGCPSDEGTVLVAEPMAPGSMAMYPQGVPHTFVADETFVVATAEARSARPESELFARPSPVDFAELPRSSYAAWRSAASANRPPEAAVGS
ncbi:MAG: cupin domain-containing protein [Planctomycetota bacterium]